VLALPLLVATLPALLLASGREEDFPLHVHIVQIDTRLSAGYVLVDPLMLPISSHIFTVRIDGDPRELTVIPWNITPRNLHVGNYNGHWNTNGSLEIQYLDKKGKLAHSRLLLRGERLLPPEPQTEDKPPTK
jgi:hypothetical protein